MASISLPTAVIGASVIGAGASAGSSMLGSSQASGAAKGAAGNQMRMAQMIYGLEQPNINAGYAALGPLTDLATSGATAGGPDYVSRANALLPPNMTQAELIATPGYQFARDQGLKSAQSAAAARGLGVSGASLKGAADYATGLADKTYLDQFNVAQKRFEDTLGLNTAQQGNITNQFNRLNTLATLGSNAASQTGTQGTSLTNQAGNFLNQAGLASAAGTTGVSSALNSGMNNYLQYQMFQKLMGGGGTGGYVDTGSFA